MATPIQQLEEQLAKDQAKKVAESGKSYESFGFTRLSDYGKKIYEKELARLQPTTKYSSIERLELIEDFKNIVGRTPTQKETQDILDGKLSRANVESLKKTINKTIKKPTTNISTPKTINKTANFKTVTNTTKETNQKLQQQTENLNNAIKIIDDAVARGDVPSDIGELWKTVVKNYPEGTEVNPEEILNTFKKIEAETIDPYFANLTKLARSDFENAIRVMEESRALELEQEKIQEQETLRQTKRNLEERGLTFSGEAVRQLGTKSALPTTETQGIEGLVPQQSRLLASSSALRSQEAARSLGRQAEEQLGSEYAKELGLPEYQVLGGFKGQLEEDKEAEKAARLQQIINQYQIKEQSLLNL